MRRSLYVFALSCLYVVILGTGVVCGQTNGPVVAWGDNSEGQCNVPAPNSGFVVVASGANHSLGLNSDSTIVAWGYNNYGQCNVPAPNADFVAVAGGQLHSLGLKSDSTIVAWGANTVGQCNIPAPNADFVAVASGANHSLGLKSDSTIVAWGHNNFGQCDIPAPNAGFVAIACNGFFSLGLKSDSTIVGWGSNHFGQYDVPAPNAGFVAISAGAQHSLGLKSDSTVVAWGDTSDGKCNVPAPNADFVAIAAGVAHSLGLKSDSTLVAWGSSAEGQCDIPAPNFDFLAADAGWNHSLGIKLQAPTADFVADDTVGVAPHIVNFTDLSAGSITSWRWYFGDGDSSDQQNPVHTYTDPGVYDVTLEVDGPRGPDVLTKLSYITVYQVATADFVADDTVGVVPHLVTLTDSSTGAITSWRWYFGDGDSSDQQNPTHTYTDPGTYDVTLEADGPGGFDALTRWDYIEALPGSLSMQSIVDVENDQGRQVRINFLRAANDRAGAQTPVTQYEVFRRIDTLPPPTMVFGKAMLRDPGASPDRGVLLDGWEFVAAIPAHGDQVYNAIAPTLADSTITSGMHWSIFFIRAATNGPTVFYDSDPDSGYSIDNLAPSPPRNLRMPSSADLAWDECEAEDFDYFAVYGSEVAELDPTAMLIGYTIGTEMDLTGDFYGYYHVTATDFSGNEGDASSVENTYTAVGRVDVVPTVFSFGQNDPNPFETKTSVSFDLPAGCDVRLSVFDAQGRLVKTLSERAYPIGHHTLEWTGDDDNGRLLSVGVYFMKIEAGENRATRKVILLR